MVTLDVRRLYQQRLQVMSGLGAELREDLDRSLQLGAEGKFVSLIDRVMPLHEAPAAHRIVGEGLPLGKVILDLARQVGLSVSFTPGVLALLPPATRERFSLLADGVTLADAFNQIAAATGLTYAVRDTDVRFTASAALTRAVPSPAAEPVLFWITVKLDGDIPAMIPVYAADCPPELKALITRKKAGYLQAWRKAQSEQ